MLKISQKGQAMPESPIRKLVPFAESARARGVKIFPLNIGQPDIETPEVALKAVRDFDKKVIEYSHSAGMQSLREKLVQYYKTVDIDITPEEIIVGAGASEALLFAFQSIMDPDDEVIIPEPFYANYNGFATNAGINVKPIISSIESGFALPPIEDFEKNITGLIYNNKGEWEKALEYYLKAEKIGIEVGDRAGLAFTYFNIGVNYMKKNDTAEGNDYLILAGFIAMMQGMKHELSQMASALEPLLEKMGEERFMERGKKLAREKGLIA